MELNQIMWLGGIAGSGKTTISNHLADEFNLCVYHADDSFASQDISEEKQPYMWNAQKRGLDIVLNGEPKHDADYLINHSIETFEIVVTDVLELKPKTPVLVEGVCLFPKLLHNLSIKNAFFITQTIDLYERLLNRNTAFMNNVIQKAENPKKKYDNTVETYAIILEYIKKQVENYNYPFFHLEHDDDRIECEKAIKKYLFS